MKENSTPPTTKSNKLRPDYDMANRFLDALTDSTNKDITFQFFTDNKKLKSEIQSGEKDPLAKHIHKTSPIDLTFVVKKQKKGAGVYIMVNQGNGKGRKGKNVIKIRAHYVDLDGAPLEPAVMALRPHIIVESSPGRWHLYWLVFDCTLNQFKSIQQAIARKFNGDKSCCDLSRVLRLPGFYHLKGKPVMTKLIETNDFPRYSTQQVIDGLGLDLSESAKKIEIKQQGEDLPPSPIKSFTYTDPKTGEVIDLQEWASLNPGYDIVKAIDTNFMLGSPVDGKHHIVCPFAQDHTDTSPDLSTFVANADSNKPSFTIHCMHDHCVDRDRLEFLQVMFEKGWLPASDLILELRKPLWISLPFTEIASSPEWSILAPEERRIAWDLMYLACQIGDGTIVDNDRFISKFLGLPCEKWQEYREILAMTGWLIVGDKRLTNSIVKREFDNAQMAYSKVCAGGKKGGRKAQQKKRNGRSPPSSPP